MFLFVSLLLVLLTPPQGWEQQVSGTTASLRGVSAVNERVAWASGAGGTLVRTADGGRTWQRLRAPDNSQALDFRDIDALDERTAYILSIGPGEASRIYRTDDAGSTWQLQFTNRNPKAFYDAIVFSSRDQGWAISDSVENRFVLLETRDGGRAWAPVDPQKLPAALPGEGAFAASGSNIASNGRQVWIGTGAGRVLRSADGGRSWQLTATGLATSPTAGIFSICFRDRQHGIVVGGDYQRPTVAGDNAATTSDGGRTWQLVRGLGGFRSAVVWLGSRTLLAVGPSGTDLSRDDGRTWQPLSSDGFHAVSKARGTRAAWAVGAGGRIAKLRW